MRMSVCAVYVVLSCTTGISIEKYNISEKEMFTKPHLTLFCTIFA